MLCAFVFENQHAEELIEEDDPGSMRCVVCFMINAECYSFQKINPLLDANPQSMLIPLIFTTLNHLQHHFRTFGKYVLQKNTKLILQSIQAG